MKKSSSTKESNQYGLILFEKDENFNKNNENNKVKISSDSN